MFVFSCIVVLNISKIQTESNSQPDYRFFQKPGGCAQYFKDTNWKQFTTNKNIVINPRSCAQYFKDTNWKQFTTGNITTRLSEGLCSIFQRYKLKAIHNVLRVLLQKLQVVLNISKIQTESNSQLTKGLELVSQCCAQYFKDTNWKQFTTHYRANRQLSSLCSIFQRYKLKAIHNELTKHNHNWLVVLNISKIQTESNSQH